MKWYHIIKFAFIKMLFKFIENIFFNSWKIVFEDVEKKLFYNYKLILGLSRLFLSYLFSVDIRQPDWITHVFFSVFLVNLKLLICWRQQFNHLIIFCLFSEQAFVIAQFLLTRFFLKLIILLLFLIFITTQTYPRLTTYHSLLRLKF